MGFNDSVCTDHYSSSFMSWNWLVKQYTSYLDLRRSHRDKSRLLLSVPPDCLSRDYCAQPATWRWIDELQRRLKLRRIVIDSHLVSTPSNAPLKPSHKSQIQLFSNQRHRFQRLSATAKIHPVKQITGRNQSMFLVIHTT